MAVPVVIATPVAIPIPAPLVVAVATAAPSCPPPSRDADWVKPDLPADIEHVQPSPSNAGWIAAWSRTAIYASTDAGATFHRVLDGDTPVIGASFDCFGRVVALRGRSVGIRDGDRERWMRVPGLRALDMSSPWVQGGVLGGGPDVVVVGVAAEIDGWQGRIAISHDLGATWTYHDPAGDFEPPAKLRGRQDADGTIHAGTASADCMDDDLEWTTISHGQVTKVAAAMPEGGEFGIYPGVAVTEDHVIDADGNAREARGRQHRPHREAVRRAAWLPADDRRATPRPTASSARSCGRCRSSSTAPPKRSTPQGGSGRSSADTWWSRARTATRGRMTAAARTSGRSNDAR